MTVFKRKNMVEIDLIQKTLLIFNLISSACTKINKFAILHKLI
jgi:hypothetical protein